MVCAFGAWCLRPSETGPHLMLHRLEIADPVKDADSAIVQSDFRIVGVSGFAPYFPGADQI
jgi:hypothetical protein